MTTRASAFVLVTLLFLAAVASSIGRERERLDEPSRWKKDKSAVAADPKAITKLIDDINAAARTNKERMTSIIVINTDVGATTLERQKKETGLTLGDVYVAHSLALATKKKFSAIVALHKSGQSWAQIAKSHNVTLKGSSELIKEMQKQ
jgi:Na+-transporting methylmalonyl-CoA/oxaloacetate decarboxylase gamma subunit